MDYNERKRIFDGKREWAVKRMLKNAEIKTLTEEQHDVLSWLCTIRHEFHMKKEEIWLDNSNIINMFDDGCSEECEINRKLKEVGLTTIDFEFSICNFPTVSDFECLSDKEKSMWEDKAEQYNKENPDGWYHSALTVWKEESWEYEDCIDILENLNNKIEKYLKEIDEKHGTDYCPSGYTRLL